MSKERAARRVAREAAQAKAAVKRARVVARRDRVRALRRRLTPRLPGRRRAWLLGRRTPGQRIAAIVISLALFGGVWYFVDSLPTKVALTLLLLLVVPVLVVMLFPRKVS